MTFRIAAPSLTAVAALLIVQPAALRAQDTTTGGTTTEQPVGDEAVTGGAMATDEAATDDAVTSGAAVNDGATIAGDAAAADGATTDTTATDAAAGDATSTDPAAAAAGAETGTATGAATTGDATMAEAGAVVSPPEQPNADMQAVLDKLAELGAKPIEELSVEEARTQPSPADAAMAVMEERSIGTPAELAAVATRDVTYPAADGSEQPARVYTPEGEGPFPLIVYYHGGGWVIATIDTYDASARALAAGASAVVVSVEYRHAPEAPFPAAHEDANAAFSYFVENSGSLNADSERLAVAGESAGGNLAFDVAAYARDNQLTPIDHMLLVYPVAGDDMTTPSYQAYADAKPLSRAGMMWFVEHVFADPAQAADPRTDLIAREDLAGMPPATVINAEIDPLQSEGEVLAQRLQEAGVEVQQMTYGGVTHEFFGMGAVVPEAKEAQDMATTALTEAFAAQ